MERSRFIFTTKEITPEYIYGCSYEERDKKFFEGINFRKKNLMI